MICDKNRASFDETVRDEVGAFDKTGINGDTGVQSGLRGGVGVGHGGVGVGRGGIGVGSDGVGGGSGGAGLDGADIDGTESVKRERAETQGRASAAIASPAAFSFTSLSSLPTPMTAEAAKPKKRGRPTLAAKQEAAAAAAAAAAAVDC